MEDLQIIDLYFARDERAILETDAKYGKYCFAVADNILGQREDAEECVNDTWLRAWNAMPPKRPAVLRTFLAKITRNLALDIYRKMGADKRGKGQAALVLEELEECIGSGEQAYISAGRQIDGEQAVLAEELGNCIRDFAQSLPERECNIFVRRYFYAEPVSEIAKRCGMTANHVGVVLARLRGKLREQLRREGFVE